MGALMDGMLSTMRQVWDGEVRGASGPMPALPPGRPGLLFGGFAPASFNRMAAAGDGWVAPSFGFEPLVDGIAAARAAWSGAGRSGRPRIVVARYFSLGSAPTRPPTTTWRTTTERGTSTPCGPTPSRRLDGSRRSSAASPTPAATTWSCFPAPTSRTSRCCSPARWTAWAPAAG
jgi:hypothetical protein